MARGPLCVGLGAFSVPFLECDSPYVMAVEFEKRAPGRGVGDEDFAGLEGKESTVFLSSEGNVLFLSSFQRF